MFLSHSGLLFQFLLERTLAIFIVYVASLQDKLSHFIWSWDATKSVERVDPASVNAKYIYVSYVFL